MSSKKKQPNINIDGATLARALLVLIGTGVVTFAALCAPNTLQLLRPWLENERGKQYLERRRIKQALVRLAKRRQIELYEKGNDLLIEVTEHGKRRMKKFEFEKTMLPRHARWDRRWRVIIFDIPEKFKSARGTFQRKLKDLGCYPLQKSVFVYPFDCRDEIDFVAAFCEIKPFVHYLETGDLDQKEGVMRKFFHLI